MSSEKPVLCLGGAHSAIAREIARRHAQSHRITGFLRAPERLRGEEPADALWEEAEATDPRAVAQAIQSLVDQTGRIDAYVHCVGSIFLKPLHLTRLEDWEETLAVNLHSAFYALRAIIPIMQKQKSGRIVLISTVAARVGLASHEAIAAAKGGLLSLAQSAAATYASAGIRVNTVAPGLIASPLSQPFIGSEQGRRISEKMHPLGQLGEPAQVASLITWLLSADAANVTGQCFGIDGGMSTVLPKVKA